MPIPKYDELTWPLLESLKDGQPRSTPELVALLSDRFQLTPEERDARLPSRIQTYITNRTGWAGFYLGRAGLIAKPKRGLLVITAEGLKVLERGERKLDRAALMEFPKFREWIDKSTDQAAEVPPPTSKVEDSTTPEEQISTAFQTLRAALKQELLALIHRMDPVKFERLVLDLLLAMGYGGSREEAARMTKLSHDEGIDGIINEDRLGLDVIYVQAKRWEGTVGRREIQSFVGALAGQQAHKGIFITTSTFADSARTYARTISQKVILVDGDRLADLMIDHDIAVSKSHTYEIKRVDSDYFGED